MNRAGVLELINGADLAALADEGETIGDSLTALRRAWSPPYAGIEVSDDLVPSLVNALDELNACYDENGFEVYAHAAHRARIEVADALDTISAAVYAAIEHLDDEGDPDDLPG